jgi:DNA-binding response OmpR family regulator
VRVLVVEDDRRLAGSIRRGLDEAGFATDAVHDGEEGIAAARATAYDVILLDVMLPGVDGIEVCRTLRGRRMRAPILMLTARDSIDDRVLGLEAGADDYLMKPFALRELIARIRALSRRHVDARSARLEAAELVLDTSRHELMVGGVSVKLTAKEYAILEYFMLHPGHLLTRDQVIEHAWSYDFEGGRNLVEVYIGRLRRKIIDVGGRDPITTLRGSGYRLRT